MMDLVWYKMLVLIAFDITDDKQRRKVVKELEGIGERIQYSVFEAQLTKSQLRKLQKTLLKHIAATDRINYYPLCAKDIKSRSAAGAGVVHWPDTFIVL